MKLPPVDVHNETACYQALQHWLHPHGLACPQCGRRKSWRVHRRRRAPVLDYRCTHCGCVFNAWTGTVLSHTHLPPSVLWQLLLSIATQQPLAEVVRATGRSRSNLAVWHRRLRIFLQDSSPKRRNKRWINS